MPQLSHSFSGELRLFSYYLANGTLALPLLKGVDYSCIFQEPSALEQTYAIFANVIELDESGKVINAAYASRRAVQYILSYVQGIPVKPPFEEWETALY